MKELGFGFFMDPLFNPSDVFEDWEEGFGDTDDNEVYSTIDDSGCLMDTSDRIIEDPDTEDISTEDGPVEGDVATQIIGMAGALSEEMTESSDYDMDENTDAENWKQAMEQNYPMTGKSLRPFEQLIQEVCSGKRSLFKVDDL